MKVLVQGDDYGFTKGVTYGILDAAENGVLRNTGLFANMPFAEKAVQLAAGHPEICLGIDFNIVSGRPVAKAQDLPHLLDEKGEFIRSSVRVSDPRWQSEEGRNEMFPYEETYIEIRAQYERFLQLAGKKPCYLHVHSITPENYMKAIRCIAEEEKIPFTRTVQAVYEMHNFRIHSRTQKKEFNALDQLNKHPLEDFLSFSEEAQKHEYVLITGHPGFVDDELMSLTTLSLERMKDHAMVTSPVLKQWLQDHQAELITYNDLK